MKLAWFSPLPPSTSGIAAYSAELLPLLRARGLTIDTFTDANAHEFVWMRRRTPYDLTVYQLGNAQCHDYMWAYLFRYRGLVVLHDAQLHQARAWFLTRRWLPRTDDYSAEMRANHPDAPADLPYLVPARMGDRMYQHWPMVRLVVESARLTLVHNQWVANDLRQRYPAVNVHAIDMGVAEPVASRQSPVASHQSPVVRRQSSVRTRHSIPNDGFVIAAFGGVTPEKRIGPLIRAIGAIAARRSNVHLLLVGGSVSHYDAMADAAAAGIGDRVHLAGFVSDEELPEYLHAADVCACLRWPTNRETSASWLRCIAAGRATLITELAHLGDLPTLDPRSWRLLNTSRAPRDPIAVSIDLLDEDQSLQLALERLIVDPQLRDRLGQAAHEWWRAHHQLPAMAAAYEEIIGAAINAPVPAVTLPAHLVDDGTSTLRKLAGELDVQRALHILL